jgi:hypothetical protein
MGFTEFFCLRLKFDLVYLEFMDELFRCLPFQFGRTLLGACEMFLGTISQRTGAA